MSRALKFAGIVLLCAGWAMADDQKQPRAAQAPGGPKANGVPKKGAPKASNPQRIVNPANPAVMLFNASPEERERALEKATPQQQEQARNLLAWYDNLSPADKEIQLRRVRRFQALSPAQRAEMRDQIRALGQLPQPRRALVNRTILQLQKMTDDQRQNTLASDQFKQTFSPEEQKIITTFADVWMPPE